MSLAGSVRNVGRNCGGGGAALEAKRIERHRGTILRPTLYYRTIGQKQQQ